MCRRERPLLWRQLEGGRGKTAMGWNSPKKPEKMRLSDPSFPCLPLRRHFTGLETAVTHSLIRRENRRRKQQNRPDTSILLMLSVPQTHIFNQIPLASQNVLILCFHESLERRMLSPIGGGGSLQLLIPKD